MALATILYLYFCCVYVLVAATGLENSIQNLIIRPKSNLFADERSNLYVHKLFHLENENEGMDIEGYRLISRHERDLISDQRALQGENGNVIDGTAPGSAQVIPLFQGIGTHYADVWVGSGSDGPQRQTVIVDTGSHYTAFPCTGCSNCGESYHTNYYFDPAKSQSFKKMACSDCLTGGFCRNDRCEFSQSYTEGSSWHAYQAEDKFWVGRDMDDSPNEDFATKFAVDNFMFGCQFSETGLFRTQLANGIMGMSAHAETFVKKLYDSQRLTHNRFTMCFQRHDYYEKEHGVGSGAMVFGGVDTRLHTSQMLFVRNINTNGWFTVHITGIYLRPGGGDGIVGEQDKKIEAISFVESTVNGGKGVIVDSGTTDTYLHRSLKTAFSTMWKAQSGRTFSNSHISIDENTMLGLPTVILQLRSKAALNADNSDGLVKNSGSSFTGSGDDILVAMPPSHYMEYNAKSKLYTPRIYFTESSGGVLGANFMQGHDVLFDWQEGIVGFARSDCDYESLPLEIGEDSNMDCIFLRGGDFVKKECSALSTCNNNTQTEMVATGHEVWGRVVGTDAKGTGMSCSEVAKDEAGPGVDFDSCNGVECFEVRPCSCTCQGGDESTPSACKDKTAPLPSIDDTPGDLCEDLWGSCQILTENRGCQQVRIESTYNPKDKNCYQVGNSTRACNKGACASSPRRVPYRNQAIIGISQSNWATMNSSNFVEQFFEEAMASALEGTGVGAGDIQIVMVDEWKTVDNVDGTILGTKVIVEVGIPNLEYNSEIVWSTVCDVQTSKVSVKAEEVKVKLQDLTFTKVLLVELKMFAFPPSWERGDPFENVESVKLIEAWAQKLEYCGNGGNGGNGEEGGKSGVVPDPRNKETGGSAGIVLSFLLAFSAVGAFIWHKNKKKDLRGKYEVQVNEEESDDAIEMT